MNYFEAVPGWRLVDFRELWAYRELAIVLADREVKVRYRQAVIGVAWVVLQPLIMFLVFQTIFSLLNYEPTVPGFPYALTFFCGWMPWQLLALSMRDGSQTLVSNRQLVTKVYFPRMLLPTANVLCGLLELAIGFVLLLGLMAWYGFAPAPQSPAVILFVALTILLAIGSAVFLSALNGLYRDIGYIVPFLIQVGFFASPVAYDPSQHNMNNLWWYELNPMAGIIAGFRWALLGTEAPTARMLTFAVGITLLVLAGGLWYFRRVEDWIADRI
ncbi:MAG: ABC transporter permease [Planctomycetaceae bacterium]|nr:ABC transporter permease [Planctomycetaceae bacterium]